MLLDAFDTEAMTKPEEDDESTKQLNELKTKIGNWFSSVKMWFEKKFSSPSLDNAPTTENNNHDDSNSNISTNEDSN